MIFSFNKPLLEARITSGVEYSKLASAEKLELLKENFSKAIELYPKTYKWLDLQCISNTVAIMKFRPVLKPLISSRNYKNIEDNVLQIFPKIMLDYDLKLTGEQERYLSNPSIYTQDPANSMYIFAILDVVTDYKKAKKYFIEELPWSALTTTPTNDNEGALTDSIFLPAGIEERNRYTVPRIAKTDYSKDGKEFPWNSYKANTIYRRIEIWSAIHGDKEVESETVKGSSNQKLHNSIANIAKMRPEDAAKTLRPAFDNVRDSKLFNDIISALKNMLKIQ